MHLRMIRVLQGEESLRRVTENALGAGQVPKHEAESIRSAWRRDARMGEARRKGGTRLGELTGGGMIAIVEKKRDG